MSGTAEDHGLFLNMRKDAPKKSCFISKIFKKTIHIESFPALLLTHR